MNIEPMIPSYLRDIHSVERIRRSESFTTYAIGGLDRKIALPITLTPFASSRPCSARCRFCSEALSYRDSTRNSASLRPADDYPQAWRRVLKELRGLQVGLSLSGLEATDDSDWLLDVLDAVTEHEQAGGVFDEKVLYSNGTGLAPTVASSQSLLLALQNSNLTRIEMSRHSADPIKNACIMRFREGISVSDHHNFESTIRLALNYVPIKLVCVLQHGGVASIEDVQAYLMWARNLGVTTVVFRELSRLHDLYRPNKTAKYIEEHRTPIEPLVDAALIDSLNYKPMALTEGYYYWNMSFRWREDMTVIFETSDYLRMKLLHQGDTVYKLVFHANGNLCADWDPSTCVLLRT